MFPWIMLGSAYYPITEPSHLFFRVVVPQGGRCPVTFAFQTADPRYDILNHGLDEGTLCTVTVCSGPGDRAFIA